MDNHRTIQGLNVVRFALSIVALTAMTTVIFAKGEAEKPEPAVADPKAAVAEVKDGEGAKKEEPAALHRISLGEVLEWDEKACGTRLKDVSNRMRELQQEKMGLYRREHDVKASALAGKGVPEEYKKLQQEIADLKKQLNDKTRELATYMGNIDAVKELRKEHEKLDAEWKRLEILKDAINRQVKGLKSEQKGAADAQKAG